MINGIDERSERRARELEDEYRQKNSEPLTSEEIKAFIDSHKGTKLEDSLKALGLEKEFFEMLKAKAIAFYEDDKIDEALRAMEILRSMQGFSQDSELRELNRALRYADEGRSIVSQIDPETEKYFADIIERLNEINKGAD